MKVKIISLLLLLCFLINFSLICVSADGEFKFEISSTTTPYIGDEYEAVISLTNYAEIDDEINVMQSIKYQENTANFAISWGSMEFVYDAGIWDSEKHKWVDGAWKPVEENSNLITLSNIGNLPVQAVLEYKPNESYETITAAFFDSSDDLVEVPIIFLPEGSEQSYWLQLSGKTVTKWVDEFKTIGMVTVTIIE